MRQRDALTKCGIQNCLAVFDFELDADRFKSHLMGGLMRLLGFSHFKTLQIPTVASEKETASSRKLWGPTPAPTVTQPLVAGVDGETCAVLGKMLFAVSRRHFAKECERRQDRVSADVIERPHILG